MRNNYLSGMPGRAAATGGPLRVALSGEKFMHANMTLNHSQAYAVFSAMCALNDVDGRSHIRFDMHDDACSVLHAVEYETGEVQVFVGDAIGNHLGGDCESYANQAAFATAYGLA